MSAPMVLKPHQVAARAAVFKKLAAGVSTMLCALPTGTGKTCFAVDVSRAFGRTLFVVHREELIRQTVATVERVNPDCQIGYVVQGRHEIDPPFVVGMVQTLHNRLHKIPADHFDLVVIDEAHHSSARTWREVAEHFTPKLRLGLSATPERLDGSDLSHLFSEVAFEMKLAEAVESGYLVKPLARQCLTACSLSGVRTVGGDLNEGDLAIAVDVLERNQFIVSKYQQHAPGRRAIAFAVNILHSKHIAEEFNAAGIAADWIAGNSPDRAEKLARFAAGEIKVLASCMVLTEGFDDPGVDCVLLGRPTKSRPLFAQMIGRGLRLHPGKENCVALDFTDNCGRHQLASAWRFLGYTQQPADDEVLSVDGEKKRRESKVAAVDLEREINLLLPPPEVPVFAGRWQYEPATEKQLEYLARLGYDVIDSDYSKGQSASLIANSPVSAFQISQLKELGYDVNQPWNRGQYSRAMDAAKETGASALLKMRRAGFKVAMAGKKLSINPVERLDIVQLAWVDKNKPALMLALKEEKKIELKVAA
jgi:superfamily II DNA or RNA helicase